MNRLRALGIAAATLAATAAFSARPALAQSESTAEKIANTVFRFAGLAPDKLPENVWSVLPEEETQNILFFNETYPLVLSVRVRVGEKGFMTVWNDFVAQLHKFIDHDEDGVVTKDEAELGSWRQLVNSSFNLGINGNQDTTRISIDTSPADGVVTVEELSKYLRGTFSAFQLQNGRAPDSRADTLFKEMDRDGDGKLSEGELKAADTSLRQLDMDGDEMILVRELIPYRNPYYGVNNMGGGTMDNSPFVAIEPSTDRAKLARRLLKLYDNGGPKKEAKARDGKLGPAELGIDRESFERCDADKDGLLDVTELAKLPDLIAPLVQLSMGFAAKTNNQAVKIEVVDATGKVVPLPPNIRRSAANNPFNNGSNGGGLEIDLEGVKILVRASGASQDATQFIKQQFKAADGDNNKYLEMKEVQQNYYFNNLFKAMDRDGDGKLFEKEMNAYLDKQSEAAASRTLLTVSDRGRALFEVLDGNHDKRISARELRDALKNLIAGDRDGDKQVKMTEVPRQYQLTMGRGQAGMGIFYVGDQDDDSFQVFQQATPNGAGVGPTWFRRMDRNKDGDLSPREFLGTRADFDRLDADHDGLIDAKEAAKP